MHERTRLERLAIDAHHRGDTWAMFWEQHRHAVGMIEPYDRAAYHRIVARLSHIVTCGDVDGMTAAGDWEHDDAQAVPVPIIDDTTTAARCLWSPPCDGS